MSSSKLQRHHYDCKMRRAAALPETPKALLVEATVRQIRKDENIRPLVLCAFLQDHAALIREALK